MTEFVTSDETVSPSYCTGSALYSAGFRVVLLVSFFGRIYFHLLALCIWAFALFLRSSGFSQEKSDAELLNIRKSDTFKLERLELEHIKATLDVHRTTLRFLPFCRKCPDFV